MRKALFLTLALTVLSVLCLSAQNRKEDRRLRQEQRRLERALYDSVRVRQAAEDSVNIGYGYIKKKHLTNSVSKVKVNDLQINSYINIGEYLKGRVPGLQVMRVGDTYKYLIRGISSINASTDPLFVVDGMEVSDINFINPNDVVTVEVLKDASASIYGNRGACGVILITTRRP